MCSSPSSVSKNVRTRIPSIKKPKSERVRLRLGGEAGRIRLRRGECNRGVLARASRGLVAVPLLGLGQIGARDPRAIVALGLGEQCLVAVARFLFHIRGQLLDQRLSRVGGFEEGFDIF